jgi:hypothetical protein
MGTRSLTYVEESWETCVADEDNNNEVHKETQNILCMYRQHDGYLDNHGLELAKYLQGFNIVNGIGHNTPERAANGMGCLAAQLITHFKHGIGSIYIYHSDAKDCGEEYTYTIYKKATYIEHNMHAQVYMRVYDVYAEKVIFDGTPDKLIKKLESKLEKV